MKNGDSRAVIDGVELSTLLLNFISTTAVLALGTVIKLAGRDAWITVFTAILSGAYAVLAACWLGGLFPGKTLVEYLPRLVGNVVGKTIGLGYILYFAWIAITVTTEFIALLVGTGVFNLTPNVLLAALLIVTTTYSVFSGIEVIGRTSSVYWPFIGIFYLLFILLTFPLMKFSSLLPVGDGGLAPILKSGFFGSGYSGELFILAMLIPYTRNPRVTLVTGQVSVLLIAFYMIITIISLITVMGVETASRSQFAPFNLADYQPLVGIKSFLVIMWIIGFWTKVALLQFVTADGLSQLLGIKERRPLILPVAFIILVFAFVFYENSVDLFETTSNVLPGMGLFFSYLIPTLLLIIGLVRTRSGKKTSDAR